MDTERGSVVNTKIQFIPEANGKALNHSKRQMCTEPSITLSMNDLQLHSSSVSAGSKKSAKNIFMKFAGRTDTHGMNYIFTSTTRRQILFWSIVTLAGLCALIANFAMLTIDYLDYETRNVINRLDMYNMALPAITICNNNPLRMSKVNKTPETMRSIIRNLQQMSSVYSEQTWWNQMAGFRLDKALNYKRQVAFYKSRYSISSEISNQASEQQHCDEKCQDGLMLHFYLEMNSLDSEILTEVVHQLNDTIINCSFNNQRCSQQDFKFFPSLEYGDCYTFHSESFEVRYGGYDKALSMALFLELDEYIHELAISSGVRITLHDPQALPNIQEKGVFINSFTENTIKIQMTRYQYLGYPYSSCVDEEDYLSKYGFKYTRDLCYEICYTEFLLRNCKCLFNLNPLILTMVQNSGEFKKCRHNENFQCLQGNIKNFTGDHCTCKEPCNVDIYKYTVNSIQPTSEFLTKPWINTKCTKNLWPKERCMNFYNKTTNEISKNLIKLQLLYENQYYEQILAEARVPLYSYLSNIGGSFGLYLGGSIVCIIELLDYFWELLIFVTKRIGRKK